MFLFCTIFLSHTSHPLHNSLILTLSLWEDMEARSLGFESCLQHLQGLTTGWSLTLQVSLTLTFSQRLVVIALQLVG